jgi:hypothetical protein
MANLALNKGALTVIWVGFSLLVLAVFALGFLTGKHWSDLQDVEAPPRAEYAREGARTDKPETEKESPRPETEKMAEAPAPPETADKEPPRPEQRPEPEADETAAETPDSKRPAAVTEERPVKSAGEAPAPEESPEQPMPETVVIAGPDAAPSGKPAITPEKPAVTEPGKNALKEEAVEPEKTTPDVSVPEKKQEAEKSLEGTIFFVQVASFRSLERAAVMRTGLHAMGLDADVIRVFDSNNQPWYVVHIGDFRSREEAEKVGRRYESESGGSYTIREFDAQLLAKRTITPEELPTEAEQ